jgi:ribosomal protein L21E
MVFKPGDRVRVARANYLEEGSRSFVGMTGTCIGANETSVGIRFDDEEQPYGFAPEEVEHA